MLRPESGRRPKDATDPIADELKRLEDEVQPMKMLHMMSGREAVVVEKIEYKPPPAETMLSASSGRQPVPICKDIVSHVEDVQIAPKKSLFGSLFGKK